MKYTQAESNLSTMAGIAKTEGVNAGNFRQVSLEVTEVKTYTHGTVTIEFEDESSITVYSPECVELT